MSEKVHEFTVQIGKNSKQNMLQLYNEMDKVGIKRTNKGVEHKFLNVDLPEREMFTSQKSFFEVVTALDLILIIQDRFTLIPEIN